MTTAVDSNVLLDVFLPDPAHAERSLAALERALAEGALIVCETVTAEVCGQFDRLDDARSLFDDLGLKLVATSFEAAHAAGKAWRAYRRRGGKRERKRERVLADFLVGAHAVHLADALVTRDRGYYKTYFPRLKVIQP